jgi:hypothetical protein
MKYLPLLLFVLAASACNNTPKKPATPDEVLEQVGKNPSMNAGTGKFSVTVPEGWQRLDTSMNGVNATFMFAPKVDNFRPNINIVSESMNGADMETYFVKNVNMMSQYMQNFKEISKKDKDINGVKGKVLEYTHSQNGVDMDVTMALIPHDGIAYVITVTTPKGKRADYQKEFDAVVKSFRVS